MSISVTCKECNATYTVPDASAGRTGNCRKCNALIFVRDPSRPAPQPLPPHYSFARNPFFLAAILFLLLFSAGALGAYIENVIEWHQNDSMHQEISELRATVKTQERRLAELQRLAAAAQASASSIAEAENSMTRTLGPYTAVFTQLIPEFNRTRPDEYLRVTFACLGQSISIQDREIINRKKTTITTVTGK